MTNIAFVTLGCPKNEADSDKMKARLLSAGYSIVDDPQESDVLVINTCSFIVSATEESIETILDLCREWLNDNRKLLVAGCMVSRYGDDLLDEFPEVAAFIPVADESSIVEAIEQATGKAAPAPRAQAIMRTVDAPYAYVMIADGCHRTCSYCTIPSIRGPFKSKPLDEILNEVSALVDGGVKEVILIGQDITAWGRDLDQGNLVTVLRAVCALPGDFKVRVMYLQPEGVTDELLDIMAAESRILPYIEMPLQHCEERVLRRMNRAGNKESFLALINKIRRVLPDVVLRTTLIAGFPDESEDEFESLLDFIQTVEFDYVGVFPYSPEEGTQAARLDNQLPENTRISRAQELMDMADTIGWSKASSRVGCTVTVLIEGIEDSVPYGRWSGQAPDIDGIVRIVDSKHSELVVGQRYQVDLTDSILFDLEGVVVDA